MSSLREQIGHIIDPQAFKAVLPASNYEALRKADAILALLPAGINEDLLRALNSIAGVANNMQGQIAREALLHASFQAPTDRSTVSEGSR